jgi:tetratricopeptide (TPR) repeat protein
MKVSAQLDSGRSAAAARFRLSRAAWLSIALVAAVFLAYQSVWRGGFIWDDNTHVPREELRSWAGLERIWCDPTFTRQQYYPLLHTFFWIEHRLWGDAAPGYHLVNIALHAANAVLLAFLLRRLRIAAPWLAAAVFALHPMMVESVAWISETKNTLSLFFVFSATRTYLAFDSMRRPGLYLVSLTLFLCALLSKATAVPLPAALLVLAWWQRGRIAWRHDVVPLLPFFGLSIASGIVMSWVEWSVIGAQGVDFDLGLIERILIAGRAAWFYLGKLFWPFPLTLVYPRWAIDRSDISAYAFPLAVLVGLVLLWRLRHRTRAPLAAALLFLGLLFPALGFLNVNYFKFSFVADHLQYIAAPVVITFSTAALLRLRAWAPAISYPIGFASLLGLGTLTWLQAATYRDANDLYRLTLERNPDCWIVHSNVAALALDAHQFPSALTQSREAIRLQPRSAVAHMIAGTALLQLGHLDQAATEFETTLQLDPSWLEAHNSLGNILVTQHRDAEAITQFERALAIDPNDIDASYNLANALAAVGRLSDAIRAYQAVLILKPNLAEAHVNLGNCLVQQGLRPQAIEQFQAALKLNPDLAEAHYNLAGLLVATEPTKAVNHYAEMVRLQPDFPEGHYYFAVALIKLGRLQAAREQLESALQLRPDYPPASQALAHLTRAPVSP